MCLGLGPSADRRSDLGARPESAPVAAPSEVRAAQHTGGITTTQVISYTYDPLGRLVDAARSAATGESFEYQYDAAGNPVSLRSRDERPGMDDQHHTAERYGGDYLHLPSAGHTGLRDGDGRRLQVLVEGQGPSPTRWITWPAAGLRSVAEETLTGTVSYLYGMDCLGEYRDEGPGGLYC